MKYRFRTLRFSLAVYIVVLVLYAALMGWWVYFFATEGEHLLRIFQDAGTVCIT